MMTSSGVSVPVNIDEEIELLRRKYLQLRDPARLSFPEPLTLKLAGVQARIYDLLFRDGCVARSPPSEYTLRVLKRLIYLLENAVDDPEEDVRHVMVLPSRGLIVPL